MAMLSGVHACRSGVYYNSQKFPKNWIAKVESLPARFRNAGYLTAGYGKIAHAMKASMPDYTPGFAHPHNSSMHVTHRDSDLFEHVISGTQRDGGSENFTWGRGNHAIRDVRYRYIRYRNGEEELYDHRSDEFEWHNLADDPQYQKVKTELAAYLPKFNAPNTEKLSPPTSESEWDDLPF